MPTEIEKPQDNYADFMVRVVSREATALITDLTARISALEHARKLDSVRSEVPTRGRYRKGPKGVESLRNALGRFVGHLLMAKAGAHRTDTVFRSLKKDGFTGGPVTFPAFDSAWRGLEALELLSRVPGQHRFHPLGFDGGPMKLPGQASVFEATAALLTLAQDYGVSLAKIEEHFVQDRAPLELRTFGEWEWSPKSRARKIEGRYVPYVPNERTDALASQVRRLNEFLCTFKIEGARFFGLYRGFNTGKDVETFAWNKGGRLYAYGDGAYQWLPGEQRALIKIDGEPTVEIDISASYLTIFHGLTKQPLDTQADLWGRIQIDDKMVAKDWVNLSLTTGSPLAKWPKEKTASYRARTGRDLQSIYPAKDMGAKALAAFPGLRRLDGSLTWAELMFAEAEVVAATMTKLMVQNVPAFPVFDSIIVPLSKVRTATGVLFDEFYQRIGRRPLLKTKSTLPGASEAVRAAIHDDERWVNALDL
ncbi:hypothetical protein [Bradyrhizobium guangdongense]|uniref:Uncharacterized protein n=1 Tax=Bradyrhizobium guangdongense TaxID=1325090 RepID=A0A410VDB9_9BRAD|nr:hypothetical protein [Bradyrhizobium guangdongense]QAU41618.1 hypothetical protein X265_31000 [Bradyrhizobium guangdongense]QOZ62681.1 hypothetical protein XH86_31040 [Bradyrhizobium guangdongense]GGI33047.1 hypothetical protein GCM10010987_72440 [Bradyrhizobium guangdongense]